MIYFLIFISLVLVTLSQFAFIFSLRYSQKVTSFLHLPKKTSLPKFIFGSSMVVFFLLLFIFLIQLSSPQTNPHMQAFQLSPTVTPLSLKSLKQLEHEDYKTGESYYYLYTNADKSQAALEVTADSVKKSVCQKPCTINFYDETNAYILDRARISITSSSLMQEWNQANYVFVAEHYLGYLSSAREATFSYYPFKDWYFKKMKNQK